MSGEGGRGEKGGASVPHEHDAATAPQVVREMPRTKNIPRRCEGAAGD